MQARLATWAHARLAKTQVLFWGHPHTSGVPNTIDYFISGDGFEPRNRARFDAYSEQLVRFETSGVYFRHPRDAGYMSSDDAALDERAALLRRRLNVPADATLYVCPQSLPKFHPAFDDVLLRLASDAIVLITYDPAKTLWRNVLRDRLETTAALRGVSADNVRFEPLVTGEDFFGLLRAATLLLDPYPFGGGVTTLEAFSVCRAVVTAPALQSVVTLAAGFYELMGLDDAPVVADADAYVEKARALAADDDARRTLEASICAAGDAIFASDDAVDEWARFLKRVSRR